MAFRYKLSDDARVHIIGLYHWIGEDSPERAERWLKGLHERIQTLNLFPHRCPITVEGRRIGRPIRLLIYGKKRGSMYHILFEVAGEEIQILAIRHASRRDEPL